MRVRAAVIGGGVAGLGAAWRLAESGASVTLFERDAEFGGRCRTFVWRGQWRIRGAAAFVSAESNLIEQARAIGEYRAEQIESQTDKHSWTIWHDGGRSFTLRDFTPAQILRCGKLPARERLALGRVLPKLLQARLRHDGRDLTSAAGLDSESACAFFARSSPAFVDYILEPVMQMFCGYERDDYSLAWLVWLMASPYNWARGWWTYADGGVGHLTRALAAALARRPGVELRRGEEVVSVRTDGPVCIETRRDGASAAHRFDAVVVAVPGSAVAGMMPGLDAERRSFLTSVRYVGHHILYALLRFDTPGQGRLRRVLPTAEGFGALSNFTLEPTPDGWEFYGEVKGGRCASLAAASDAIVLGDALDDLARALPSWGRAEVLDAYVQRNPEAICARPAGYVRGLDRFRALPPLANVAFAGDWMINSTVGQAHWSGLQAADAIVPHARARQVEARERNWGGRDGDAVA